MFGTASEAAGSSRKRGGTVSTLWGGAGGGGGGDGQADSVLRDVGDAPDLPEARVRELAREATLRSGLLGDVGREGSVRTTALDVEAGKRRRAATGDEDASVSSSTLGGASGPPGTPQRRARRVGGAGKAVQGPEDPLERPLMEYLFGRPSAALEAVPDEGDEGGGEEEERGWLGGAGKEQEAGGGSGRGGATAPTLPGPAQAQGQGQAGAVSMSPRHMSVLDVLRDDDTEALVMSALAVEGRDEAGERIVKAMRREWMLSTVRTYRWLGVFLGFWPMESESFPAWLRGFWGATTSFVLISSLAAQLVALVVQSFGSVANNARAVYADNALALQVLSVAIRISLYYFLRWRVFGTQRRETVRVLADQAGRASEALLLVVTPTYLVIAAVIAAQFNAFATAPAPTQESASVLAQSDAVRSLVVYSTLTIGFWDTAPAVAVAIFAIMAHRFAAYIRDYLHSLPVSPLPVAEEHFRSMNRELNAFSTTYSYLVVLVDLSFLLYILGLVLDVIEGTPLFPSWLDIALLALKVVFLFITNIMAMRVTEAAREIYPAILRIYRDAQGLAFALEIKALEERGRLGFHVAGVPVTKENLSRAIYIIAIAMFYLFHEASTNNDGGLFG